MNHVDRLPLYAGIGGVVLTAALLLLNHLDVQLESRGGWSDEYAWNHIEALNAERTMYLLIGSAFGGGIGTVLGFIARGVLRRS